MTRTYTTISGDMWDLIAYKLWGDESLFPKLMEANRDHVETSVFSAGVDLTVPELDESDTAISPPWSDA